MAGAQSENKRLSLICIYKRFFIIFAKINYFSFITTDNLNQ